MIDPRPSDNPSKGRLTRREFGKTVSGAAVGLMVAPAILRGQNLNDKLNVAIIGAGGRGGANAEGVSSENIVALCDVDGRNLRAAAQKYPGAKTFDDFRKVFDQSKDFDAVVVSICEHTHALATMLALKAGKHVYCEKPLTHDVWEARQIRLAAEKAKVATQMGIQIHSNENYHRVVELIQKGVIGPVREVHVWVSRAWGWQSKEAADRHKDIVFCENRPQETMPVPEGLNWDLWLGPAPARPFNDVYVPGPKWYRWWDFGNGTMSDLGSHWIDLPFWALKLKYPLTVEASGPPAHPEIAPASFQATYEYGPREDLPAVRLTWYQGENKPDVLKEGKIPAWDSACLFIGDKGMLLSDYDKYVLLPEKDFEGFKGPDPFLPRPKGHYEDWLQACKGGPSAGAAFEYSGWLTEANHLGNVAYRTGKKLEWDSAKLLAKNAKEADPFIRCSARPGWELV